MALFSKSIEKRLQETYVPMLQDLMKISALEAKKTFRGLLKRAKAASKKDGTANLSLNSGDMLLETEADKPDVKDMFTKKRKEGVRNEDIRWWWNMHDLERCMMVEMDNLPRMAMFTHSVEHGMSFEEAAAKVKKYHPKYGDPEDTSHASGKDRPLPYELKDRVNIYIEKKALSDPEGLKKQVEQSSSFNALVRDEIRKGNI